MCKPPAFAFFHCLRLEHPKATNCYFEACPSRRNGAWEHPKVDLGQIAHRFSVANDQPQQRVSLRFRKALTYALFRRVSFENAVAEFARQTSDKRNCLCRRHPRILCKAKVVGHQDGPKKAWYSRRAPMPRVRGMFRAADPCGGRCSRVSRSEEHTSELQSLR